MVKDIIITSENATKDNIVNEATMRPKLPLSIEI